MARLQREGRQHRRRARVVAACGGRGRAVAGGPRARRAGRRSPRRRSRAGCRRCSTWPSSWATTERIVAGSSSPDQVVVEDDALGRAEAADVRVEAGGAPATRRPRRPRRCRRPPPARARSPRVRDLPAGSSSKSLNSGAMHDRREPAEHDRERDDDAGRRRSTSARASAGSAPSASARRGRRARRRSRPTAPRRQATSRSSASRGRRRPRARGRPAAMRQRRRR